MTGRHRLRASGAKGCLSTASLGALDLLQQVDLSRHECQMTTDLFLGLPGWKRAGVNQSHGAFGHESIQEAVVCCSEIFYTYGLL